MPKKHNNNNNSSKDPYEKTLKKINNLIAGIYTKIVNEPALILADKAASHQDILEFNTQVAANPNEYPHIFRFQKIKKNYLHYGSTGHMTTIRKDQKSFDCFKVCFEPDIDLYSSEIAINKLIQSYEQLPGKEWAKLRNFVVLAELNVFKSLYLEKILTKKMEENPENPFKNIVQLEHAPIVGFNQIKTYQIMDTLFSVSADIIKCLIEIDGFNSPQIPEDLFSHQEKNEILDASLQILTYLEKKIVEYADFIAQNSDNLPLLRQSSMSIGYNVTAIGKNLSDKKIVGNDVSTENIADLYDSLPSQLSAGDNIIAPGDSESPNPMAHWVSMVEIYKAYLSNATHNVMNLKSSLNSVNSNNNNNNPVDPHSYIGKKF